MNKLDYTIIGSGSSGNSVRIENLLIDAGLPFKKIKNELYKCKFLFYTHTHSDHLLMSTYKQIKKMFPNIIIIGNKSISEKIKVDIISSTMTEIKLNDDFSIMPFEVPHDVECQGLVFKYKDLKGIYVTDSAGTKSWVQDYYDYLFIESNHDINKINVAKNEIKKYGYDVFAGAKRHTSTQESMNFYLLNRKNEFSEYIELHKSDRFY